MRSFITGITGFVGTHLAEHLLANGDPVTGCSASGVWKPDAPARLVQEAPLWQWNLAGALPDDLRHRLEGFRPQVIYHLAAVTVPSQCGDDSPTELAWNANVIGTKRLVEFAADLPGSPRVLFVSSCRVYAPAPPRSPVLSETYPLAPTMPYGKTKLAAEQAMNELIRTRQVDGVIIRAFQHAGPRQDRRLMLAEWCRQFVSPASRPVKIRNLDSYLDFTDVRDVVRSYRLLATRGEAGGAYNVGCGIARRSGDLFLKLRAIADPGCEFVETRPGRRQEPIADIARLQAATGWQPEIPLEQTLTDALAYWRTRGVDEQ
jgi:GDP-4-dehydro-6-deoxy-D-mannose reductase